MLPDRTRPKRRAASGRRPGRDPRRLGARAPKGGAGAHADRRFPSDFGKSRGGGVMGGPGSGGWNRTGRGTVEAHPALEAGHLRRAGALQGGWRGVWAWRQEDGVWAIVAVLGGRDRLRVLRRARAGEGDPGWPVEEEVVVPVEWRPCPFGGERPFLLCPACRRPALKLPLAAGHFRCRRCHGLAHAARREGERGRALRRARRLRRLLGASGPAGSPVPRPKGMHRRTYERLARRVRELEAAADDPATLLLLRLAARPKREHPWSFRR